MTDRIDYPPRTQLAEPFNGQNRKQRRQADARQRADMRQQYRATLRKEARADRERVENPVAPVGEAQ